MTGVCSTCWSTDGRGHRPAVLAGPPAREAPHRRGTVLRRSGACRRRGDVRRHRRGPCRHRPCRKGRRRPRTGLRIRTAPGRPAARHGLSDTLIDPGGARCRADGVLRHLLRCIPRTRHPRRRPGGVGAGPPAPAARHGSGPAAGRPHRGRSAGSPGPGPRQEHYALTPAPSRARVEHPRPAERPVRQAEEDAPRASVPVDNSAAPAAQAPAGTASRPARPDWHPARSAYPPARGTDGAIGGLAAYLPADRDRNPHRGVPHHKRGPGRGRVPPRWGRGPTAGRTGGGGAGPAR